MEPDITASGPRAEKLLIRTNSPAHRTLPWGSILKVTNLDNGKLVEVRISDRGPFKKGRVIDLSRAAARALGMLESGVSPVQMELLSPREMSNDLVLQNSESDPAKDSN
jgi:rare lipoprotein A